MDSATIKKHEKWEARKHETRARVLKHSTPQTRLPVAMDMLAEDLRHLIENGTKEQQLDALDAFKHSEAEWNAMIFDGK